MTLRLLSCFQGMLGEKSEISPKENTEFNKSTLDVAQHHQNLKKPRWNSELKCWSFVTTNFHQLSFLNEFKVDKFIFSFDLSKEF